MKSYNKNIWLKIKNFKNISFKRKINLIFIFFGIKFLINKIIFVFLNFFINNKMGFIKRIIFKISKKKSKYIFFENKEKFVLFTNDNVISQECYVNDNFEFEKFCKVLDFLKKNYQIKKLYDIGANIGVTCIPAVNRGYVKQAIAVEPESENFKLLNINISLNNLNKKIDTFNYALSSENDKNLDLEISHDNSGGHRIFFKSGKLDPKFKNKANTKSVMSKSFDSLFSNINAKEDLIWIDTQGFEANILSGANKLIASGAPIVIEFWPYALKQNNDWNKIKDIINQFKFYSDLSKETIELEEVNQKNIDALFSGWDEEQKNKPSLFTDLLLISSK